MRIEFSKSAKKELDKMQPGMKRLVRTALLGLTKTPPEGDIKTLQGFDDGRKRLRVGRYRIIYKYIDCESVCIFIIDIGTRGDIYK